MAINLNVSGNTQPLEAAVQAAVNRIRRQPIKITVDDKGATQPLGNMKRSADEFSKSMEAANARIIAFGASMAIINGIADAFKAVARNAIEVEKAMADINVVMNLSAQNLDKFSDGLFNVAKETGAAFNVAAQAATEYARQGLSVEQSLKRTRDALILTRLTGMDSAEAVKALTAAMNTYGNQIKDTTQLVSKFAAVDVQFAVSAEDFADAIARTGQAAKSAGVSIDELIGLVTAAQQQTARGGKVIGNSFKTIFTRIGRTDTLNQLENLGIAVRDLEGNTLGAKRILTDLANSFDGLSAAQQAQIAQTVGGVFQINILKAVLSDAAKQNGILANATQISSSATNEAIQKNEQLRGTMSAMATETGLALKDVSAQIGEIMLAPGMEKILNTVKSIAEGASAMLGDGESAGGKFANGFLKGLGNIITGPGLVVLTVVFGKLFLKAAQFAKESLTSLIGVTSEAQKQKAIQTSLVNLFGQNSALSKEMLRTDISRTEKEKIILSLLQAQVVEAQMLDSIAKRTASTLYSKGYGASLTPRRGRATGHIPNFAHPERAQAAKGGYAAGNIRSMNMPGEGSVIYNSSEKVKNFAGFTQPAIMPPLSSKAGKNYQKAFGSVHGFDPYAGSGYIPNFNPETIDARHIATMLIPFEGFGKKLSGGGKGVAPSAKGGKPVFGQKINKNILFNMLGVKRGGYTKSAKDSEGRVVPQALAELGDVIGSQTVKVANQLNLGNDIAKIPDAAGAQIVKEFLGPKGGRSGAKGAISGLYGAVFEEALSRRLKTESTERDYMGGDFDVRMATPELKKLYGPMAPRADYKVSDGRELQASMSAKIAKEIIYRGARGSAPKLKTAQQLTGRNAIRLGVGKGNQAVLMADGYIPNFADPLSDAIGREKAAGVPVSQIRVGSHNALMSRGNPLGLGVTNTKDEPNGLRDVFGANGYVPNYAIKDWMAGFRADQGQRDKYIEARDEAAKQVKINTDREKKLQRVIETNNRIMVEANAQGRLNRSAARRGTQLQLALNDTQQKLIEAKQKEVVATSQARGAAARGRFSGMGTMAMIGLPMIGGMIQQYAGGVGAQGGNQTMYAAGSAFTQASTGAMMGSFLGPIGTVVGGLAGAFMGWQTATEENTKALKESAKAAREESAQVGSKFAQSTAQAFKNSGYFDQNRQIAFDPLKGQSGRLQQRSLVFEGIEDFNRLTTRDGFGLDLKPNTAAGAEFKSRLLEQSGINVGDLIKQSGILESDKYMGGDPKKRSEAAQYTAERLQQLLKESNVGGSIVGQAGLKKHILKEVGGGYRVRPEKDIKKRIEDQILAQMGTKLRPQALRDALDMLPQDKKIYAPAMSDTFTEAGAKIEAGTEAYFSPAELKTQIDKATPTAIAKAYKDILKLAEQEVNALTEKRKGYIVELDMAKVMQIAQQRAAMNQLEIAKLEDEKIDNLKKQLKTSPESMTEAQKATKRGQIAAAEINKKYALNVGSADEGLRLGLLSQIKENPEVQRLFKTKFGEEGEGALQNVSNKVLEMDTQKLIDTLDEMITEAKDNSEIQKILNRLLDQEREKRQNLIDLAIKQKENAEATQKAEDGISLTLAQRADALNQLQRDHRMGAEAARSARRMRELDYELGSAQRLTAQGPGYQTAREREDFQLMEKDIQAELKIQALNEELLEKQNKIAEEYAKIVGTTGKDKERRDELAQQSANITAEYEKQISNVQTLINLEKQRIANRRAHETFGGGIADGFKKVREQTDAIDYQLGEQLPLKLRDGLAEAMQAGINGAEDMGDVLRNIAINFLQAIQSAMLQKAAGDIVGAIGFSRGGQVPAMVSNGEYVMSRNAVKKYGGGFMHSLNAGGKIPGYSNGGKPGSALAANFGGAEGYATGRRYQSEAMSGFFYSGQAGNVGLQEDAQYTRGIIQERMRKAAEKKAKKRSLMQMILGTALSFGLAAGADKFGDFMSKKAMIADSVGASGMNKAARIDVSQDSFFSKNAHLLAAENLDASSYFSKFLSGRYRGGPIHKYASGGYISGKSGIDQIPAMLSEGEYVIRASSARQLGKPLLDSINLGKFNQGGAVTPLKEQSESTTSSGNTNNINISINVDRSGGQSKDSSGQNSGQNPKDASENQSRENQLAEKVKAQVVAVIIEEQRPGGLLSE